MMPSDYTLTQITNQTARELQARAATNREAREIATEREQGTPLLTRVARLLKHGETAQMPGPASFRVNPR
jgi:hypothetical protein